MANDLHPRTLALALVAAMALPCLDARADVVLTDGGGPLEAAGAAPPATAPLKTDEGTLVLSSRRTPTRTDGRGGNRMAVEWPRSGAAAAQDPDLTLWLPESPSSLVNEITNVAFYGAGAPNGNTTFDPTSPTNPVAPRTSAASASPGPRHAEHGRPGAPRPVERRRGQHRRRRDPHAPNRGPSRSTRWVCSGSPPASAGAVDVAGCRTGSAPPQAFEITNGAEDHRVQAGRGEDLQRVLRDERGRTAGHVETAVEQSRQTAGLGRERLQQRVGTADRRPPTRPASGRSRPGPGPRGAGRGTRAEPCPSAACRDESGACPNTVATDSCASERAKGWCASRGLTSRRMRALVSRFEGSARIARWPSPRGPNSARPWNQPRISPAASRSAATAAGSVTRSYFLAGALQRRLDLRIGVRRTQRDRTQGLGPRAGLLRGHPERGADRRALVARHRVDVHRLERPLELQAAVDHPVQGRRRR